MRQFSIRNPVQGRRRLLIATVVVLAIFAADFLSGGSIRALVRAAGGVIWGAGTSLTSTLGETGIFSSRRALAQENKTLRERVAKLEADVETARVLKSENDALRQLTGLAQAQRGVGAPLTSSMISSPYGTFTIGAGSQQGLKKGDLALAGEQGFVIGLLTDVRRDSSLITLIFAPNAKREALVGGALIETDGQGNINARAQAPRGVAIAAGDVVTAPGLGGRAIGVVGKVDADPAHAFQTLYIHVPVSPTALQFVYVVPFTE